MPEPIDDPLWDLMLSTHGCIPSCGCGADFHIDPRAIGGWIDDFGENFARAALRQLDELIARGRAIEDSVAVQCNRPLRPPETVATWLRRWRSAIERALRDFLSEDVPPVEAAERSRSSAREAVDSARRRWRELEQRALDAAKEDVRWQAGEAIQRRALRRLPKAKRPDDADAIAKITCELDSARVVMAPVEDECRALEREHAAATDHFRATESALAEAERVLRRATARSKTPPAAA